MTDINHPYDGELAKFVFELRKEDPLGMIVRGRSRIEYALRQFIISNATSPRHTERGDLEFGGVLRLALILGLNSEIKTAINALDKLQKKFVRNAAAQFSGLDADNFYNALGPTSKDLLREVYEEFRIKENLPLFMRQPPATRFVWFLIAIWSAILADRKHVPSPNLYTNRKVAAGYVESIEERRSKFLQLLDAGDDFQLVLQGHSHLDHELREFVAAAAPEPTAVKPRDYDFAGALRLALVLGLDCSLEEGLAAVGALRNKFAHSYEPELTEHDARQMYEKLGPSRRMDAEQAWAAAFAKHPDMGRPASLLKAKPRDLVASSMAMLFFCVSLQTTSAVRSRQLAGRLSEVSG